MARNRTLPFGYMMKDGKITTKPNEVLAVVTIFSEYLAGKSLSEIVDPVDVFNAAVDYAVPIVILLVKM